jgi:ATP-dependent Clp protease ATP-binding subunit ClpA
VGTEQILLGLIGESTGIAAKVLKSMGVNLKDTRVEVEKIIGRGSGFVAVEIPFTPRAKRVLELSLEEARQLGGSCPQVDLTRVLCLLSSCQAVPPEQKLPVMKLVL